MNSKQRRRARRARERDRIKFRLRSDSLWAGDIGLTANLCIYCMRIIADGETHGEVRASGMACIVWGALIPRPAAQATISGLA